MASIKALVFGYFGANNFGDEWTLAAFLQGCRDHALPIAPTILSRCPQDTTSEHCCPAIPRRWHPLLRTLRSSSLLIGCGGSLLQDMTSWRSLLFYALLIWQAKMMGKKVVLLGQGLGPLRRQISRALVRWALRSCDLVTFRDANAMRYARRLGAMPSHASQTADLTFLWPTESPSPLRNARYPLGFNARPLPKTIGDEAWVQSWRRGLEGWLKNRRAKVLLLPLQKGVDEAALTPFAERLRVDWWHPKNWRDVFPAIAQVALLTAMRLHGLIAACLLGIPFVGIGYDPKVAGVLGDTFGDHLLPLSATAEAVGAALQKVRGEAEEFPERAAIFAMEQRKRARQNFVLLQAVL